MLGMRFSSRRARPNPWRKGDADEQRQAQVHADVHEILVEITAPEFRFQLASNVSQGKPAAAAERAAIRQILAGDRSAAASSLQPYLP
jgi:hypothetical protein